jgi:acetate kinase
MGSVAPGAGCESARMAPELPQIACFDTAFHSGIPIEARWYGIPRALAEDGVLRWGIGENSPVIRARICESLSCFGIRIHPASNEANATIISPSGAPVTVHVIRTNEELMIARHMAGVLASANGKDHE